MRVRRSEPPKPASAHAQIVARLQVFRMPPRTGGVMKTAGGKNRIVVSNPVGACGAAKTVGVREAAQCMPKHAAKEECLRLLFGRQWAWLREHIRHCCPTLDTAPPP